MCSPLLRIETFDSISSTQDLMRERLELGENVHGLVIRALEQKSGRGQRSRDWLSKPGGSYQTLALKDEKGRLNQAFTPIALAIGLAETFLEEGIQLGIKWPNDLHYPFKPGQKSKKVAGILCEYLNKHLLAAVGMNVNNSIPETATALKGLELERVSNTVLAGIQRGLTYLDRPSDLIKAYTNYDVLNLKEVSIYYQNTFVKGVAQGINEQGCLKILTVNGEKLICHSGARGSLNILK